jgi:L-ascorbate metabolism protein UlaG (beta-lactamase superfamily)
MKTKLLCLFLLIALAGGNIKANENEPLVSIHYLGHCSFILQFNDSLSVLTDYAASYPYYSAEYNSPVYNIYNFIPDIATYSHQHTDHYAPARRPSGVPYILQNNDTLTIKDLFIKPVRTCETNVSTPDNSTYIFKYKGLTIVHSGDMTANIKALGDTIQQKHLHELFPEPIDVLLCVMDGVSGFNSDAEAFISFLSPRTLIPMHYWTPAHKISFLNYLKNQNTFHGKNYQFEENIGADYYITYNDTNQLPTRIVSLDPYPFGPAILNEKNLAIGKMTFASSTIDNNHVASRAVDGYSDTRWQAPLGSKNVEYLLKLANDTAINGIVLKWPSKILKYSILISLDSINYDTVYTVQNNNKGLNDSVVFDKRDARYIRLLLGKASMNDIGINEIEVFTDLTVAPTISSLNIRNNKNDLFRLFPNPASEQLTLQYNLQTAGKVSIRLFATNCITERIVVDELQTSGNYLINYNLSDIPSGLYIISYTTKKYCNNDLLLIRH